MAFRGKYTTLIPGEDKSLAARRRCCCQNKGRGKYSTKARTKLAGVIDCKERETNLGKRGTEVKVKKKRELKSAGRDQNPGRIYTPEQG